MVHLKTDKMLARKDKHIGWITFNNPARLNAVSLEMWQGLADIANDFANDDEIQIGRGARGGEKAFVSGLTFQNLPSSATLRKPPKSTMQLPKKARKL